MALESLTHTADLHTLGSSSVKSLSVSLNDTTIAFSSEEEVQIPSPNLFKFGDGATGKPRTIDGIAEKPPAAGTSRDVRKKASEPDRFDRLPTVAECAAHLELLEAFYVVRQRILVSKDIDHALGISPQRETKTGKKGDKKTFKDNTFWDRRQVKWTRYIEFACVRFLAWMETLTEDDTITAGNEPRTVKHLPPLDILMVWHSYLLNPKLFYEKCGKHLIWRLRLPWEAIHFAIQSKDWTFELDPEDTAAYSTGHGLHADLYQSFCDWDPVSNPANWERGVDPVIPLTMFSLENARYGFRVKAMQTTFTRSAISNYGGLFRRTDVSLATKLRDAVVRQASFVDKMNAHLWIRSPAVEGTLRRAIDRYSKFLGILARGKRFTIVPTLDVDLAWHTNQCYSGFGYASAMKTRVGRFINHDDTIAKETLGDGFGETRKLWRVYYGKEYRICGCWDCEALISAVEKVSSEAEIEEAAKQVEKDVLFHRVVELRRRKRQPLPMAPVDS